MVIGVESDQRLEQRGGELKGQREEADLHEIEPEAGLQHRVHRRKQRLHRVVEEMTEADGGEDGERGWGAHSRGKVAAARLGDQER
jgi:hypothetical protein